MLFVSSIVMVLQIGGSGVSFDFSCTSDRVGKKGLSSGGGSGSATKSSTFATNTNPSNSFEVAVNRIKLFVLMAARLRRTRRLRAEFIAVMDDLAHNRLWELAL